MKKKNHITLTLITLVLSISSFNFPKSWFKAGSKPEAYDMTVEIEEGNSKNKIAVIKSNKKKIKGFGTLMQQCEPNLYLAKKIKLTAKVKANDVKQWAGLWMRVDQKNSSKPLSFDNMSDRPIKGTSDWKIYEIILDVPANASLIAYGVLLSGTGEVYFDDFNIEIVSENEQTTGENIKFKTLALPENLDFEQE